MVLQVTQILKNKIIFVQTISGNKNVPRLIGGGLLELDIKITQGQYKEGKIQAILMNVDFKSPK